MRVYRVGSESLHVRFMEGPCQLVRECCRLLRGNLCLALRLLDPWAELGYLGPKPLSWWSSHLFKDAKIPRTSRSGHFKAVLS